MARHKLRIGAVNYLNTRPLVYRLAERAPQLEFTLELSFDLPSRLADGLADGRYDIALIPSVEAFQNSAYSTVSDACIACHGPVLSVKLFSRVPVAEVKTLALDEGSRTSAALTQILLHERFGLSPRLETLPIGAALGDSQADAILLIGDRAIHSPPGKFAEIWDLGDEWTTWSQLPFVFAMWTARPDLAADVDLNKVEAALGIARDDGIAHLAEIAAAEAPALGLTTPQCLAYLRDNLYFHLGPRERAGLELFRRLAANRGLAPAAEKGFDDDHHGHRNDAQRDACQTAR